MKYQIGDLVRIKDNAYEIHSDCLNFASPAMDKFCGETFTIRSYYYDYAYKLDGVTSSDDKINEDGYWVWCDEWLEPAQPLYIGQKVQVVDNPKETDSLVFTPEMKQYINGIYRISQISGDPLSKHAFYLLESCKDHVFDRKWLIPAENTFETIEEKEIMNMFT